MLRRKLHSETSKTKKSQAVLVRVALFWMSHCVTFGPEWLMLLHVTGSCKEPIFRFGFLSIICYVYFRAWASVLGCDVRVNVLMWFFILFYVRECRTVRNACVCVCFACTSACENQTWHPVKESNNFMCWFRFSDLLIQFSMRHGTGKPF